MVYKRYIKRGKKIYGPYEYSSKRVDGHVVSEYCGQKKSNSSKKFIFGILFFLLVALSAYLFIGNFLPSESINELELSFQSNPGQISFSQKVSNTFEKISMTGNAISNSISNIVAFLVVSEEEVISEEETIVEEEVLSEEECSESNLSPIESITEEETIIEDNSSVEEVVEISNETEIIETSNDTEALTISNETEIIIFNETISEDNQTIVEDNSSNEELNNSIEITNEEVIEVPKIETPLNVTTQNYRIVIGKPVKWVKTATINKSEDTIIKLPKEAENIVIKTKEQVQESLKNLEDYEINLENSNKEDLMSGRITGGFIYSILSFLRSFTITGNAISEEEIISEIIEMEEHKIVDVENIILEEEEEIAIEYETEAPQAFEEEISEGKRVIVSGPSELGYTDILAYTLIDESFKITNKNQLKIKWVEESEFIDFIVEDLDENGIIDYVEWNVEHLSSQTFEIIVITNALHLDSDKNIIENVYDLVSVRDYNYSLIPAGNYLRVTFERNLTSNRDITIYGRSSNNGKVEVYEKDGNEVLISFDISEDKEYKKYLTELVGQQDTFDLKVVGGDVEFDFVTDPEEACINTPLSDCRHNNGVDCSNAPGCYWYSEYEDEESWSNVCTANYNYGSIGITCSEFYASTWYPNSELCSTAAFCEYQETAWGGVTSYCYDCEHLGQPDECASKDSFMAWEVPGTTCTYEGSCTESLANTTASPWINTTCVSDQMNQTRNWTEYDENDCGTFENVTYFESQLTGPTYVNGSWSDWVNITACISGNLTQQQNMTSTDIYGCASNITYTEEQNVSCYSCCPQDPSGDNIWWDPQWSTISKEDFCLGICSNLIKFSWEGDELYACDPSIDDPYGSSPGWFYSYEPLAEGCFAESPYSVESSTVVPVMIRTSEDELCRTVDLTSPSPSVTQESCFDTTPPSIIINSPLSQEYSELNIAIDISASDDVELDKVWFNWNGSNVFYVNSIIQNFSKGQHTLTAWANDTSGNVNSTSVSFNLTNVLFDINVEYLYREDGFPNLLSYSWINPYLDVVYVSADRPLSECRLNSEGGPSLESYGSGFIINSSLAVSALFDGFSSVQFWCNDTLGNNNIPSPTYYYGDSIFPIVNFISPTYVNNSLVEDNSFEVNVSIIEKNLASVNYRFNEIEYSLYNYFLNGMWNFDDYSRLNDTSFWDYRVSRDGTVHGATWTSEGKYGGAYEFDGVDDYISFQNMFLSVSENRDFTINFWAYFNNVSGNQTFVAQAQPTNNRSFLFAMEDGVLNFYTSTEGTDWNYTRLGYSWNPSINTWYYLSLVRNDSGTLELYIDGIKVDEEASSEVYYGPYHISRSQSLPNASIMTVGAYWDDASYPFNGKIDELRIWDRDFSSSEIYQQYISNIQKFNETTWYLYVNQSYNSTEELDYGNYTYFVEVLDKASNDDETESRLITLGEQPIIGLDLIYPTSFDDMNVTQNEFFNITVNVSCLNGNCGEINVSLDPIAGCDPSIPTCTDSCEDIFSMATSGWDIYADECYSENYEEMVRSDSSYADSLFGPGTGDYAAIEDSVGGFYSYYYCPSSERLERDVTWEDCECEYACTTLEYLGYVDQAICEARVGCNYDMEYCEGISNSCIESDYSGFNFDSSFFKVGPKGLISTSIGATPFYTNVSNPFSVTLNSGESQSITWWVNATGEIDSGRKYTFFAFANLSSNESISNITETWKVMILGPEEVLNLPDCAGFDCSWEGTTDAATNSTLNNSFGELVWNSEVNISGLNFSENVLIEENNIFVNISGLDPSLNVSTNLSFVAGGFIDPIILRDGQKCLDCDVFGYVGNNLRFRVPHFTAYSSDEGANLTIWDDTNDAEGLNVAHYVNEQIKFYSNFTNSTNSPLNKTIDYCQISDNSTGSWSSFVNMTFNTTSLLYEFNKSFSSASNFSFNVTCNGTEIGNGLLSAVDGFEVSGLNEISIARYFQEHPNQFSFSLSERHFYMNYTKPFNVIRELSSWSVKHGLLDTYSVSIPEDCWNYNSNKLLFRFYSTLFVSIGGNSSSYGQCYNGSLWKNVTSFEIGGLGGGWSQSSEVAVYDGDYSTGAGFLSSNNAIYSASSGAVLSGMIYEEAMNWTISIDTGNKINVSNCMIFDRENAIYELNSSLISTGTCFTIEANNVTLDCNNFNINYSSFEYGSAIFSNLSSYNGYNYTQIKNCRINQVKNTLKTYNPAISLINSQGSSVYNNKINNSYGSGLYFYNCSNINVTNNVLFSNFTGIDLPYNQNFYIYNNNITTNTNSLYQAYGIKSINSKNNNLILGNFIRTIGNAGVGITIGGDNLTNITNNNIITNNALAISVNFAYINNNYLSSNYSLSIINANNFSFIGNNTFVRYSSGVCLGINNDNSIVKNNIFLFCNGTGISIGSAYSSKNTTLINNSLINIAAVDLMFYSNLNDTSLIDQQIRNYSFIGAGGIVYFKDSNYGEIRFLNPINGTGTNLSNDLRIGNNSVYVNSVQTGLNKSANITIYGLSTSYSNPVILKDGVECSDCWNFTSLNAGIVVFNVSGWSNYSIGESSEELPTMPSNVFTFQINTSLITGTTFSFQADNADLTVWWNSTNYTNHVGTGLISHDYVTDGIYNISLNGSASRISFYEGTEDALIDILSNLSVISGINSSYQMFRDSVNIVNFTAENFFDDVSGNVVDMSYMFYNSSFNQSLENLDTSNVSNMRNLFAYSSFDKNISSWNVSKVINMVNLFRFSQFNQDISNWDVSNVEDMASMFRNSIFNQDISNWNVSNVEDMSSMFGSSQFNQDISNWDVSKVTLMYGMFFISTFNQDISQWNTSSLLNMSNIFNGATAFNQNLSSWNISSLIDAASAFENSNLSTENYDALLIGWAAQSLNINDGVQLGAQGINYCLGEIARNDALIDTHNWIIADSGRNCTGILDETFPQVTINSPLNDSYSYSTTSVDVNFTIDEEGTCRFGNGTDNFTMSTTDNLFFNSTYSVTSGNSYTLYAYCNDTAGNNNFSESVSFGINETIAFTFQINTSLITGTTFSFQADNADLTVWWNSTNYTNHVGTGLISHDYVTDGIYNISLNGSASRISFYEGTEDALIDILSNLSVISGINSSYQMFRHAANFVNASEPAWFDDVSSSVTDMNSMFFNSLFNQSINNWNVSSVTDMSQMFYGATSANPNVSNWDTSKVIDMSSMFRGATSANPNVSNWDTSKVIDMSDMFNGASSANPDVSSWNTSKVTNMRYMFAWAYSANLNVSNWDTKSVINIEGIFLSNSANPDVSKWNISSVMYMSNMFYDATSANPNVSNWDTSKVIDISRMFAYATSANPDVRSWNTSLVQDMNYIFRGASSANPNVSNWDTSNVEDMSNMFYDATSANPDVRSWNTSKVTNMRYMFYGATAFNQNLSSWNVSAVINFANMLDYSNLSVDNYDSLLIGWNTLPTLSNDETFGVQGLEYCLGADARTNINETYNWVFSGDSLNCSGFPDTTPPQISIIFPPNNTNTSNVNLNINYTVSDETAVDSCWYSNDSMSLNTTLSNCDNMTSITWSQGQHNVTIWVNDSSNNINFSSVTFTIDSLAPNVTLLTPFNGTVTSDQTINFTANISDEGGLTSAILYIYNATGLYNSTIVTFAAGVTQALVGIQVFLVEGVYTWFYEAFDWVGNLGTSETSGGEANNTLTVDTTQPVTIILYPTNTTYNSNVTELNYSSSGAESCWWSNNSGVWNSSLVSAGTNFTGITSVDGSNSWTVYCNDSANNLNSTSVTFTTLTGPGYTTCGTLSSANTAYNLSQNISVSGNCLTIGADNITLNCNGNTLNGSGLGNGITSIGRVNLTIINCTIMNFGSGTTDAGLKLINNNLTSVLFSNFLYNYYGVYFTGTKNSTLSNLFIRNNTNRGLYLSTNSNNNTITNSTFYEHLNEGLFIQTSYDNLIYNNIFNDSISDSATNYWNTTKNCAGTNIIGGDCIGGNYYSSSYNGKDNTGEGIGNITYTITGGSNIDYLPLTNEAGGAFLLTPPRVTITSPITSTYTSSTVSIEIGISKTGYCEYSLDAGIINNTLIANSTNTGFIGTLSSLANGNYLLSVYCNDSFGNKNYTENVSFIVNVEIPSSGGSGGGGSSCTPSCSGKECGSDGCSGSCGTCNTGESCISGVCETPCTNECTLGTEEKECLTDILFRTRICEEGDSCNVWSDWSSTNCPTGQNCLNGNCIVCVENWICGDWSSCTNDLQTRTCNDLKNCGTALNRPNLTQECISGLEIDYFSKNLNLIIAPQETISFNVDILDSTGINNINIKWYLDGVLQKENSGTGSFFSLFDLSFDKNSKVKAEIIFEGKSQEIIWDITVNESAMLDCVQNWVCEWNDCVVGDRYSYSYNCIDLNGCGINSQKPIKQECSCYPDWECGEFGDCLADYSLEDVLGGSSFVQGYKEQKCVDLTRCKIDKIRRETCDLTVPVFSKNVKWCQEDYVEVYNLLTNELLSRVKREAVAGFSNVNRLDISLFSTSFTGYCNYCFDGIKNFDEENIDCGGPSCPTCTEIYSFLDWLNLIRNIFWILFLLLIIFYLILERENIFNFLKSLFYLENIENNSKLDLTKSLSKRFKIKDNLKNKNLKKKDLIKGAKLGKLNILELEKKLLNEEIKRNKK